MGKGAFAPCPPFNVKFPSRMVGTLPHSLFEAAPGTQEVNSNISGVQKAADGTGAAANPVLVAAEQLSSQSKDLASQVNRFLTEVRAA
jgi:hypothetical protein